MTVKISPKQLNELYRQYSNEQVYPGTTDFNLELEAERHGISPRSLRQCSSQADFTGEPDASVLEESKSAWSSS